MTLIGKRFTREQLEELAAVSSTSKIEDEYTHTAVVYAIPDHEEVIAVYPSDEHRNLIDVAVFVSAENRDDGWPGACLEVRQAGSIRGALDLISAFEKSITQSTSSGYCSK